MSYEFFDHTADIGVELVADTPEGLFKEFSLALKEIFIGKKRIQTKLCRQIYLESFSLENLLFDFASELVYIADTDHFLPCDVKTISVIKNGNEELLLQAEMEFFEIGPDDKIKHYVKGPTLEGLFLKKTNKNYRVRVLLDV